MNKAAFQAALGAAGLSRLVKYIDQLSRPSIRLHATATDESTLKPGASKLGGLPDLPPGAQWPQWKGLPQSFIAQIRLDDMPHDADTSLPQHGMLWFFYDAQQQTFGENPADRGGWNVLFNDTNLTTLQRVPAPAQLPATSQFHACAITFSSELTITQQPALEVPSLKWTDADQQHYDQLYATFPDPADHATIHHRLAGFPNTIQDDMRQQCQLVSHGVTDENDPRAAELSKGALNWQLLLQVDSDEHAGMQWANAGMLYYWMQRDDLQAHTFEQSWLVLQSE